MKIIDATNLTCTEINKQISAIKNEDVRVDNAYGKRFLCAGFSHGNIRFTSITGNALGAYLDGAHITVDANVQDAVADTMNEGEIVINGSAGDALGYAMRGGRIFVRGDSGYRTGIHMKEYGDKKPTIVIGGKVGSFLGEYLAGGIIVVLGLGIKGDIVGNFTGTGMHGGKIYLRCDKLPSNLPPQVSVSLADEENLKELNNILYDYCKCFDLDFDTLINDKYYVLLSNASNPYKQLYTIN